MENIQSFVNENFGTIRTMLINDEPYFILKISRIFPPL